MASTFTADKIHDNPYQARKVTADDVADLVASFTEHGMQEVPTARPHPTKPGHVQLVKGHRRRAAWFIAFPGKPMPLEVKPQTDREMFENNVIENFQRKDPTPIEKAHQMRAYIAEFKVSQVEAGKLFGLNSQGAVSNMLRLLNLPGKVQSHLQAGALAERDARRLLPLLKLPQGDTKATTIAGRAAQAEPDERSKLIDDAIGGELRRWGQRFYDGLWAMHWPEQPISITVSEWTKGTPSQIPACAGCEFLVKNGGEHVCIRPACFKAKEVLHRRSQAEAAAKKLGIAMLGPKEKATTIFDGDYRDDKIAERALKLNDKSLLRLVFDGRNRYGSYHARTVLGTEYASLATTDLAALKKLLPRDEQVKVKRTESSWERQQRKVRENAKACETIIGRAGPHFAALIPNNPVLIELLGNTIWRSWEKDKRKAAEANGMREAIATELLLARVPHATPANASKAITALAKRCKVKLPRGWDAMPDGKARNTTNAKGKK